nr:hypothetical protein [uncultured Holophaga sp.]
MEIPTSVVYTGQGVFSIAKLDSSGNRTTGFQAIGNVPGFTIKQEVTKGEHRESMSGLAVKDAEWVTAINVNFSLEADNFDAKAYERYTAGTYTSQTSTTPVTGQELEGSDTISIGDRFDLGAMNVSAVSITDSTASPKTLTAGTNYALDADTGVITILDITTGGTFTGPLKAAYTPGEYDQIEGMTTSGGYYALMFEGLNLATNKKEKRIFGKCSLPPASELTCIGSDAAKATIEGAILKDKNGTFFTINLLP